MLDKLSIRQTKPKDTEELLRWWNDLFPEFQADQPTASSIRRFRDEDLSPQEAGWMFEHWVFEAFCTHLRRSFGTWSHRRSCGSRGRPMRSLTGSSRPETGRDS